MTRRKVGRVTAIALFVPVAAAAVFAAVLLLFSPGRLRHILDDYGSPLPNSIYEKVRVSINGVDQGMIIRAGTHRAGAAVRARRARDAGILPGPEVPHRPRGRLHGRVVGPAGRRALPRRIPRETMTCEQFVSDTIAVTDYLRSGSARTRSTSWATRAAATSASRRPPGTRSCTAPTSAWRRSPTSSSPRTRRTKYMLEQYRASGDKKMVRKLEAPPAHGRSRCRAYESVRDQAMHGRASGRRAT